MQLLTIGQFCERAQVSRRTVYREIKAGRLPVRRFGSSGRVRIPESALEAAVEPPPEAPRRRKAKVVVKSEVAEYMRKKGLL